MAEQGGGAEAERPARPPLKYTEPSWAAQPVHHYELEVLKAGSIIETLDLSKEQRYVVGRIEFCDIVMDHPSISRYHAVIQHSDDGHVYIYDLGSTHGSKLNKTPMPARKFQRFRIGEMAKFGMSSRLFILKGPATLEEAEEEHRLSAELEFRQAQEEARRQAEEAAARAKHKEEQGVSWGMAGELPEPQSDADLIARMKGEVLGENDETAAAGSDAYYVEDPKKALRVFFEREHAHFEFQMEQTGPGHARVHSCSIELPLEDPSTGQPILVEATSGRKKDAVQEVSLKACQILDKRGVLRQGTKATGEVGITSKRRRRGDDSDDDDTFFDRTGAVERKRARKSKRSSQAAVVYTYASLCADEQRLGGELQELQLKIDDGRQRHAAALAAADKADDIDRYMLGMKAAGMGEAVKKLRFSKQMLDGELAKVLERKEIAKPDILFDSPPPVASKEEEERRPEPAPADAPAPGPSTTTTTAAAAATQPREDTRGEAEAAAKKKPGKGKKGPQAAAEARRKQLQRLVAAAASSAQPSSARDQSASSAGSAGRRPTAMPEGGGKARAGTKRPAAAAAASGQEPEQFGLIIKKKKAGQPGAMDEAPAGWDDPPEFSNWAPPTNQSGDGRTALNDKLGY